MRARELPGAVAFVTGGASGIGRALGSELARRGARVTLADRDGEGARAAAAAIEARGAVRVEGIGLDVTDGVAVKDAIDLLVAREGRIDLLFNNAGIGLAGEVRDTSIADWRKVLEVCVIGVVHGVAAAYPHMAARGRGAIVNTASGAGLVPRPFMVAYAAAKHAVVGLSTSLAAEAADLGVSVHAVCPGYIDTGIQRASTYRNLDHERLLAAIPVRPMSAERCARVVLRGVGRGRVIIPVTGLTWLEWWLWRLCPALVLRAARWRARRFRAHRRDPEAAPDGA